MQITFTKINWSELPEGSRNRRVSNQAVIFGNWTDESQRVNDGDDEVDDEKQKLAVKPETRTTAK